MNQIGDVNYNAAPSVTQAITVTKSRQTITGVNFMPNTLIVNGTTTMSATTSTGLAAIFSSTTPEICTVNGITVSGLITGTCIIAANQPGNVNYQDAAMVSTEITIEKGKRRAKYWRN